MQTDITSALNFDVFARDSLGMKDYATNIVQIIRECNSFPKSNDNNAFVIGINASWGSGKTYFDNMIIDFLGKNKTALNIQTVYYDAWANDFWDNAFEPFFSNIVNSKSLKLEVGSEDSKDLLKALGNVITLGIRGYAYKKLEDTIDTAKMDEIYQECQKIWKIGTDESYQVDKYFPEYSNFTKAISTLRSFFTEAVSRNGGKIVIFIDELDRCKPTFAIQTLEIVKHLFNIEGLVFVFSLDLEQLSYCVQAVYGEKIDAIGYLERFFNFITTLPRLDYSKIAKQYLTEFQIQFWHENFVDSITAISQHYNLSLRDLRTVLSSLHILQHTSLKKYCENDDAMILYLYFLTMKYKYPTMLNRAVYQQSNTALNDFLKKHPVPFLFEEECFYSSDKTMLVVSINQNTYQLVIQNGDTYRNGRKILVRNDEDSIRLVDANGNAIHLSSGQSLNHLIYPEDIPYLFDSQHLRVIEYIYKNLELCGSANM